MAMILPTKCKVGLLALGLFVSSAPGGINWKAVWLEKPSSPVVLEPGAAQKFTIMGLNGADVTADLTQNQYLTIMSLNPDVVEVDRATARLVGKSAGQTELRISFSEATSIVRVLVKQPEAK
jgi:hypothetical protein